MDGQVKSYKQPKKFGSLHAWQIVYIPVKLLSFWLNGNSTGDLPGSVYLVIGRIEPRDDGLCWEFMIWMLPFFDLTSSKRQYCTSVSNLTPMQNISWHAWNCVRMWKRNGQWKAYTRKLLQNSLRKLTKSMKMLIVIWKPTVIVLEIKWVMRIELMIPAVYMFPLILHDWVFWCSCGIFMDHFNEDSDRSKNAANWINAYIYKKDRVFKVTGPDWDKATLYS